MIEIKKMDSVAGERQYGLKSEKLLTERKVREGDIWTVLIWLVFC